jgi:hypothetical protein
LNGYGSAAVTVGLLSLQAVVTCATGVQTLGGTHGSHACESFGVSDAFMMQASAGVLYEMQNGATQQAQSGDMTPAPTTCVDTDNGALNRLGNGCEAYSHDLENPYIGICFDPYYDDDDFSSSMCCVCPESCPVEDPIVHTPGDCEDWITFSASNDDGFGRSSHSNLAGLGPDFHKPRELR